MAFLCVDIGGTNTLVGFGNGDFKVVEKYSTAEFLKNISGSLNQVISESDHRPSEVDQVAVAVAGPMDREEGVFYPPNIDMEKVQIKKPLEEFGNVKIINDCTSAVLGEYHYGDHDVDDLVYVTISSGIGSGIMMDGQLVEGWNGNLGEVGHIQLSDNNIGDNGGNHWEGICSGNHLPGFAENLTGREFDNARHLFEEYENRDCDAKHVIEEMKEINARGFAAIVNMFNPEKIVVGGAVALNHPRKVVEPLQDDVDDKVVNEVPEIKVCALDDKAVIHGLRAVCNGKYQLESELERKQKAKVSH
jgi:glucokinase